MTVVNKQVANWLAIHTHWISFIFGIYHVTGIIAHEKVVYVETKQSEENRHPMNHRTD